ncbi:MAG: helix-turn-helix domain-containing protein, partial [Crocinitomicaceae bacterium]|nr:helix-turn-helix domain-containing protein [Crocinitomicaceae bacterium]
DFINFLNRIQMFENQRPLYTLTVEEFKELSKTIALDNSYLIKPAKISEEPKSDIIYIDEIIQLTGYKESTIYSKVCRREIPVISSGRPLTFSREEIIQWMKDGRPTVPEMLAKEFSNLKNKKK